MLLSTRVSSSRLLPENMDDQLYFFLFKALDTKLVKTSKYGRNISRFLLKN